MRHSRAGRPRAPGPREPNGRPQRPAQRLISDRDMGTEELRAQRLRATGSIDVPHDSPLAVLRAHDKLTREQYDTGERLAALYIRVFGQPFSNSQARYDALGGGRATGFVMRPQEQLDEDTEAALAKVEASLSRCFSALDHCHARTAVIDMAVYQGGEWLVTDLAKGCWTPRHAAALQVIATGLDAVSAIYSVRGRHSAPVNAFPAVVPAHRAISP